MMQTKFFRILVFVGLISLVFSCVPASKFEQVKDRKERCETERDELKASNEELTTLNNELKADSDRLKEENVALVRDTTIKGNSYRTLTVQYDKINELYNTLLENSDKLRAGADAEAQKTLALLQATRDELQRKEDALRELEANLNKERANLETMKVNLEGVRSQIELKEAEINRKNAQVEELQSILNRKDSVVNALRAKVSDALLGFEGDGLTVTTKNGKVYVSLEEQLLFQSGKWSVDPKGQEALNKLATVLVQNEDINVMIEGHTDDVPYNGSTGIKDNWDLSVKRATSIVKILLQNKDLDPKRLIPSGRGEFLPIDPEKTKEARRKNRRTEIILTPDLDELFEILESN